MRFVPWDRMHLLLPLLVFLTTSPVPSQGLFQDEAGQHDFTLVTAGHGVYGSTFAAVSSDQQSVLTSSCNPGDASWSAVTVADRRHSVPVSSCFVTCRDLRLGTVQWRRNVCSRSYGRIMESHRGQEGRANLIRHAVYSFPDQSVFATLDQMGSVRMWDDIHGNLLSEFVYSTNVMETERDGTVTGNGDVLFTDASAPRIVRLGKELLGGILTRTSQIDGAKEQQVQQQGVVVEEEECLVFFTQKGYQKGDMIGAREILAKTTKKGKGFSSSHEDHVLPSIFSVMLDESFVGSNSNGESEPGPQTQEERYLVIAGWKHGNVSSSSGEHQLSPAATTYWKDMAVAEIVVHREKDAYHVQMGKQVRALNPQSSTKDALLTSSIRVEGDKICATKAMANEKERSFVCYSIKNKSEEVTVVPLEMSQSIQCMTMTVTPAVIRLDPDRIVSMHMLQCTDFFMTFMVGTRDGVTKVYEMKRGQEPSLLWEQEEGLSDASSAIFLDRGASTVVNERDQVVDESESLSSTDEEEEFIKSLTFSSRMSSQWKSISSFVMGGFVTRALDLIGDSGNKVSGALSKNVLFGLNKVAVILSSNFHKVLALDTSSKGSIVWKINLNPAADWHKIVHGDASSRSSALGQGKHHPHSPEILILSQVSSDNQVEWKCVDGLRGHVISESSTQVSSSVMQVLPIYEHTHSHHGCKQHAALILNDGAVVFVPSGAQHIQSNLFAHTVDKDTGVFRAMKVNSNVDGNTSVVEVVGETTFDPKFEKIINVAYPQRHEVIQSPFTILGDDSLILKYLNPHLCVIVTEATLEYMEEVEGNPGQLYDALNSVESTKTPTKKKPVGASKPGEEPIKAPKQASMVPTLFVNLVDTVSGQVLHRASHSHASLGTISTGSTNIPVVISENWVVYAFVNLKTRRTEIGVLTLHEGMIDKHGISAFSTPEQQLTFSSFASQKPIVLSKTYAVHYPVSAIGVTNTKGGISSKNFLLATGMDGKIVKIDRRLLDPRRPFGEPKTNEKKEGLLQYAPLLPLSPLFVESYSNYVESPTMIISAAANLESQTLIMALGGPDIFFTRLAPSNGFDSLPDSFNKLAIVIVLVGLYVVLRTLKKMSEKKFVHLFWS